VQQQSFGQKKQLSFIKPEAKVNSNASNKQTPAFGKVMTNTINVARTTQYTDQDPQPNRKPSSKANSKEKK